MEHELKQLKQMLVDGFNLTRSRKQKNMPTHGVMTYLLSCIVQCNKTLNKLPKELKNSRE